MTIEQLLVLVVLPVLGYLLGSVPFAFVIGKINGVDIRTLGSRNIGATNLGRTLGAKFFWMAFLLDAAKGFLPVLAVALLVHPPMPLWTPLITGVAAWLGHLYPIWLGFRGGKGVATGFGVVLGFWPLYTLAGIIGGVVFVFVLMVHRYISLASIVSSISFVIAVAWLGSWDNRYLNTYLAPRDRWPLIGVAGLFALMIIWRHRGNILRLMKGTEPQIGQREIDKAKMPGPPKNP